MRLERLEHVNIRTANLSGMVDWYCQVLGMKSGARPPFDVPGAWLYAGDMPVVHLVEEAVQPKTQDPRLEHFAFSATGLAGLIARLEERAIGYDTVRVPDLGLLQVNIADPDGNHIHVDFTPEEADAAGF